MNLIKCCFLLSKIVLIVAFAVSCKSTPGSSRDNFDPEKAYRLHLNPANGSEYLYEITNASEMELTAEGKEILTSNSSDVTIKYQVSKDSAGQLILTSLFEKIKLSTKKNEIETELDAANANNSIEPTERMLGKLLEARLQATVNEKGDIVRMEGLDQLRDSLLILVDASTGMERNMAKDQWDKKIGNGLIKNAMQQLFKIFPDSVIHVGDTWRINSTQEGEIPVTAKNTFRLKAINDDIAVISSKGILQSSGQVGGMLASSGAVADLKGEQTADYEIETKTGMLINSEITSNVEGKLQVMGQEIPVKIETKIKMRGRKLK